MNTFEPKQPKIKVHSVLHFHDLMQRGHHWFQLEARVQPSGEMRTKFLSGVMPREVIVSNGKIKITNSFEYDACMLVLEDPSRYDATIYCYGDWSSHDEAEEIRKWA